MYMYCVYVSEISIEVKDTLFTKERTTQNNNNNNKIDGEKAINQDARASLSLSLAILLYFVS